MAQPRRFVRIVAGRPEAMQYEVAFVAVMQGSESIEPEAAASIRTTLRALAKQRGRVGRAAVWCLAEFDRTTGGEATH